VKELSIRFGVSAMTIRRDLTALDETGEVRRVWGGVVLAEQCVESDSSPRPATEVDEGPESVDRADVLILNPMDQRMARMIVQDSTKQSIPVIAESIPFPGITTLVAIDSFRAGVSLGQQVGTFVRERMGGVARVLFVGLPSFSDTADRARGFFDGLGKIIPQPAFALTVNGRGLRRQSHQVTMASLSIYPEINVIIGVNDQAALGALDAVRELGVPRESVLLGTFGLEGSVGRHSLLNECPNFVGIAVFPEFIGRICADVAVKAYNGLPLPAQVIAPTAVVTHETLPNYYELSDGSWKTRSDLPQHLALEEWTPEAATLAPEDVVRFPKLIGFVRYLHDEYYDQLVEGLRERAEEHGVGVRVTDASADLAASIELARRSIAKTAAGLIEDGDAVILDAGTTNAWLAQELSNRSDLKVTVITNSLPAIEILHDADHVTLIGIGGVLHRPSQSFLGAQTEAALGELRADKVFLGVSGVSIEHGISNAHLAEADLKRRILKAAKEVIMLADSLKIGQISLARIAPISVVDKLVTDDQLSSLDRLAITQEGVEIVFAEDS